MVVALRKSAVDLSSRHCSSSLIHRDSCRGPQRSPGSVLQMANRRAHLRNAPIVEALVDFRVALRPDASAEAFANLQQLLGDTYSNPRPIQSIHARFGMAEGRWVNTPPVQAQVGWRYLTQGAVAQFRLDGFTFNKLEPYTTWEQVFGEASRLWQIYLQAAHPTEISRLAVRYINRMRVPAPADLENYLEAPPQLPQPIPQRVTEFLSRVVVEDGRRRASAIILQALEASLEPATVSLLLDIDAFRGDLAMQPNDPTLLETFVALRDLKNEVFYAMITERTVEMYA